MFNNNLPLITVLNRLKGLRRILTVNNPLTRNTGQRGHVESRIKGIAGKGETGSWGEQAGWLLSSVCMLHAEHARLPQLATFRPWVSF
jgi:hypothetical protein